MLQGWATDDCHFGWPACTFLDLLRLRYPFVGDLFGSVCGPLYPHIVRVAFSDPQGGVLT